MKLFKGTDGFSLIEIMIVISIISILAAISVPIYEGFVIQTLENSCLHEVKGYSNQVYTFLNDENNESQLLPPIINACESITDASQWIAAQDLIIAKAKAPSTSEIKCNILTGAPCQIMN